MPLSPRPATYTKHTQTVASLSWNIMHNLQGYPIVDTYIDTPNGLQKMIPASVVYVSENVVQINFSTARTGVATIVV